MKKKKRRVKPPGSKNYSKRQTTKLERLYLHTIGSPIAQPPRQDNSSLRQPSAFKIINSVTTYGAYENPI